ncbi:MAG: DUF1232 domain-containing protein [Actinomycetota bacterium]|nr:DUF1232 domain-containing protein [Actinomycetota bacterium]
MISVLVGVVVASLGAWVALVIALLVARPDGATLADALKVLPDAVRLVRRLAIDPELPPSVRRTLWLLGIYLVSPIDLIPDFIPVLGYADDAIVAAMALRRVVRVAGPKPLDRHWTGSPAGLAIVRRLAGLA